IFKIIYEKKLPLKTFKGYRFKGCIKPVVSQGRYGDVDAGSGIGHRAEKQANTNMASYLFCS
ncbi:hypothetical protein ACQP3L_36560, partial [Escherichia coli]